MESLNSSEKTTYYGTLCILLYECTLISETLSSCYSRYVFNLIWTCFSVDLLQGTMCAVVLIDDFLLLNSALKLPQNPCLEKSSPGYKRNIDPRIYDIVLG